MKTIILVMSGLFDRPEPLNSGHTPLAQADTPVLDRLAAQSETGLLQTVPTHFTPVENAGALTLLGIDPLWEDDRRAGFELIGGGLTMKKDDVALFCRLVSLSQEDAFEQRTMLSAAPPLSETEERLLWDCLKQNWKSPFFELRTAPSGKTFLLWHKGEPSPGRFSPPEAAVGGVIGDYLPAGDFTPALIGLMREWGALLGEHPLCREYASAGKPAPNGVWLWGACPKPSVPSFSEQFSLRGAALCDDDYFGGIARTAGLSVRRAEASLSPGALTARSSRVMQLLSQYDCVYDDRHSLACCGSFAEKTAAIEAVDRYYLAPLITALTAQEEPFRLLLTAEHAVPVSLGFPTLEAVPYLLFRSDSPQKNPIPFVENAPFRHFVSRPKELFAGWGEAST